jgi:hypothetical protein
MSARVSIVGFPSLHVRRQIQRTLSIASICQSALPRVQTLIYRSGDERGSPPTVTSSSTRAHTNADVAAHRHVRFAARDRAISHVRRTRVIEKGRFAVASSVGVDKDEFRAEKPIERVEIASNEGLQARIIGGQNRLVVGHSRHFLRH